VPFRHVHRFIRMREQRIRGVSIGGKQADTDARRRMQIYRVDAVRRADCRQDLVADDR
jgi:hypothetical protein